jgi:hypothetical protein
VRESRHVRLATTRQRRAARTQQRADAERWRRELRPRAMRFIASRTTTLTWTRALLRLLLDELQSEDDLFSEIVGPLDRIPPKRFPQAVAIALALRHSWLQSDLTRIANRLRISLTTKELLRDTSHSTGHHDVDSPARLGRVKALRFAPTPTSGAHGLDTALGRATGLQLRDGRRNPRTNRKRR